MIVSKYEEGMNNLQSKINIKDEEITKFQKMIDNNEQNIINIRKEYDLKLGQRDLQIKKYSGQIDDLNAKIDQLTKKTKEVKEVIYKNNIILLE